MHAPKSKTCISNSIRNFPCFFILDVKTRGINLMGNQEFFMTMDLTETIINRFLFKNDTEMAVSNRSILSSFMLIGKKAYNETLVEN